VMFGPMLARQGAEDVTAGPLYLMRSDAGVNGLTEQSHAHLRGLVEFPDPARPRPVHYNCWEAVYFRHDLDELKSIATRAVALGAERFVLDDGWFKGRNDDTTSLGDWVVDRDKFPDGLTPLIDHVQSLGMVFGLWVEPEMVNPDSDLYRAHPDWVLGPQDQPLGRNQMVLNIAHPEVSTYLFERLDALLTEYDIDYLKWDHNRVLPFPDHHQAETVYALLDRLRAAHPGVEIESCASGGGRMDWGILQRTHRVWLSDSNDALERMRMQAEALPFLIPEVTGSHVGPRECHTSGRVLPIALRGWIAAQRHFGFEMDPRELTEGEAATLTRIANWWKANRTWLMPARRHLLDLDDPERFGEMAVARDGSQFALWLGQRGTPRSVMPRPVPLTGLEPDATYRVRLLNADDIPAMWSRNQTEFREGAITLSGAALMGRGLIPPVTLPASIYVFQGERVA
jgi:alpha-galactosidase